MSLKRKAPPSSSRIETDLEHEIDSYIKSSPLTSAFRSENPNLWHHEESEEAHTDIHPVETSDSPDNVLPHEDTLLQSQTTASSASSASDRATLSSSGFRKDAIKDRLKRISTSGTILKSLNNLSISRQPTSNSIVGDENSHRFNSNSVPGEEEIALYWKYHVLKFGKDLYLTTNPGMKHVYCRSGPGFYVEVQKFEGEDHVEEGFSLLFRNTEGIEQSPFMIISKFSNSPDYTIDTIGEVIFNPLPHHESIHASTNYKFNYMGKDWQIGSIPRTRMSRIHKLRGLIGEDEMKHIGKKNIYFYCAGENENECNNNEAYSRTSASPILSSLQILGLFRPYESKLKKKIIRSARNVLNDGNNASEIEREEDVSAGTNIRKFYQTGDGLYSGVNPVDDTPSENKLGWITIYESIEGIDPDKPLFNIILGIILAIGYDQSLKNI